MKLIVSILVLLSQITLMAQKPIIQGHRGCRGEFPENTLPAFQHALEAGVTVLEMDVCISADGQVLVSHEPGMIREICDSAYVLVEGHLHHFNEVEEAYLFYIETMQ